MEIKSKKLYEDEENSFLIVKNSLIVLKFYFTPNCNDKNKTDFKNISEYQ